MRNKRKKLDIDPIKSWKIVRGDLVEVNNGKLKGARGKVEKVIKSRNKVVVEGVNLVLYT